MKPLLFAALAIAVAAVTTVGFFTERIRLALECEAQQLIGGDLVLVSDHPWQAGIAEEIGRRGLALRGGQVGDDHPGAAGDEPPGRGEAEAGGPAGDQRHAASQVARIVGQGVVAHLSAPSRQTNSIDRLNYDAWSLGL